MTTSSRERARFRVPYGARLLVDEGQQVARGQKLAEWDPSTLPIITERNGRVEYIDLIEGITLVERMDEVTGLTSKVVVDYKQGAKGVDLRPRLQLKDENGEVVRLPNNTDARYSCRPNSILSVDNGAQVAAGDVLARIPREGSKTRDITGGLPAWPNCSRRGGRRIMPSSPRSMGAWSSARTTRTSAGSS